MIVKGRHTPFDGDISNILIIQLGDIGDVVWAVPAFRAVKDAYPAAAVSVMVREGSGCLIEPDPLVARVFEVKRTTGSLRARAAARVRFIHSLRRAQFDMAIDLRSDERGAFMSRITGAPVRIAMHYGRASVPIWRNRVFTHLVCPPAPARRIYGAAEQSLRVTREFGMDTDDPVPRLWCSNETRRRAQFLLHREGVSGPDRWVSINPFSRWQYKEWSTDKWVRIIDWLWDDHGLASIIVGSKDEQEKAGHILTRCRGRVFNLSGKTTLSDLAGVLSLSSLHVGVDSAAPHIAAAVGIPTVTIYGPSDWRDWAPVGDGHRVVIPDDACVPCRDKGCHNSGISRCLETLGIEKVREAIRASLEMRRIF